MSAPRHVLNAERLPNGGVALWLDGMRIKGVQCWGLIEELREPSRLSVTVLVGEVVWGAPASAVVGRGAPFVDDGRHHVVWTSFDGRTTPSGKRACQTCGEAWMCSTAQERLRLYGSMLPPGSSLDSDSDAPLD